MSRSSAVDVTSLAPHTSGSSDVVAGRDQPQCQSAARLPGVAAVLGAQEDADLVAGRRHDVDPTVTVDVAEGGLGHVDEDLEVALEGEQSGRRNDEVVGTPRNGHLGPHLAGGGERRQLPDLGDDQPGLVPEVPEDDLVPLEAALVVGQPRGGRPGRDEVPAPSFWARQGQDRHSFGPQQHDLHPGRLRSHVGHVVDGAPLGNRNEVVGLGGELPVLSLEVDAKYALLLGRNPAQRRHEQVGAAVPVQIDEFRRHAAALVVDARDREVVVGP
jgi:hypothetical protein